MARRPKLTDAEREQRRAADRERLKQAAEQLLTSDGWQRWVRLRARAGLARLSLSNQLLVALARPDASFVAGFKAWLDLGYCVRKGEKAIRIIAPMPLKERDRATGEETGETITLFKSVSVFDAQQVEPLPSGEPTPLQPPSQPLSGDSHAHLIAPTIAFAESLGYTVSFAPIAGSAGGWCDTKAKQIVVDTDGPANARLRTLVHEAIHTLGVDYQHYPRATPKSSSTPPP
jgi:N-terminal domain of anti-restriction factor ArdC